MWIRYAFATHFLHEYFTLIPSPAQALERGLPSLKSFFLPLYDKIVICREEEDRDDDLRANAGETRASDPNKAIKATRRNKVTFIMIFL
jgi:hypothetical protein